MRGNVISNYLLMSFIYIRSRETSATSITFIRFYMGSMDTSNMESCRVERVSDTRVRTRMGHDYFIFYVLFRIFYVSVCRVTIYPCRRIRVHAT